MSKQQELLDTVYEEFCLTVEALKIKGDTPAVIVVGDLTRALKRVVMQHGSTAIVIDGRKYTKAELDKGEL